MMFVETFIFQFTFGPFFIGCCVSTHCIPLPLFTLHSILLDMWYMGHTMRGNEPRGANGLLLMSKHCDEKKQDGRRTDDDWDA